MTTTAEERSSVCMDCHKVYICETRRSRNTGPLSKMNAIAVHTWEHGHRVDWDNPTVLRQESVVYWRRRTLEAIEIRRHNERGMEKNKSMEKLQTWIVV